MAANLEAWGGAVSVNYNEFLHTKIEVAPVSGFEVRPENLNPALKPHNRDAVMWAYLSEKG